MHNQNANMAGGVSQVFNDEKISILLHNVTAAVPISSGTG
jgi:hypothetical protein